jgi:hypothetical protein
VSDGELDNPEAKLGRWVNPTVYSRLHSISNFTLISWRRRDREAGRDRAEEGYPKYRYFGHLVRYWLPRNFAEADGLYRADPRGTSWRKRRDKQNAVSGKDASSAKPSND